ncbi:sporulation protein YpjB [Virgibacillus kimchii]
MRKNQMRFLLFIIFSLFILTAVFSILEVSAAAESSNTAKKNFDLVPFIWTAGIVGGCIAITLSYVSWRKYRGEEKKKSREDKSID